MASITLKGYEEFRGKLGGLAGKQGDTIRKRAVYVGTGHLAEAIKLRLQRVTSVDATGDLENSLGISKIKLDKNGNWSAKIGFSGYDRKGTANQLKARVLESGSSKQRKRPFVRPAVASAKKGALELMVSEIETGISQLMK